LALFDTDGYFAYSRGSLDLMFGRFAEKAEPLAQSISKALFCLGIKNKIARRQERVFVRIQNRKSVLTFFKLCGSSNPRNISRFLLWRLQKYEAKIEIEGIQSLYYRLTKSGVYVDSLQIPFSWTLGNKDFYDLVKFDEAFINNITNFKN